ncbi:MAG: polysaccharide pyruvyl transferase family protein [Coriobacteriia bacterium]|nr:polysaccharide pyruvyl transferase family protein [Coriobacteriia bacterium]
MTAVDTEERAHPAAGAAERAPAERPREERNRAGPAVSPVFSVIAATVSGDRGAEAMLSTTVARLRDRFPGARFNVFSHHPEEDRELVCDPAVHVYSSAPRHLATELLFGTLLAAALRRLGLRRLPRAVPEPVRALAGSAALVDLSGASFLDRHVECLPSDVLRIWPALVLDVPVVKLAQACGPFRDPANHWAAQRWLTRCEKVFARGEATAESLRALPLTEERLAEAADVAFLHRSGESLGCEYLVATSEVREALEAERKAGRSVLGICPSAVTAGKARRRRFDYAGFVTDIARGALRRGEAVLLFPNAARQAHMDEPRDNDLPVIAEIAARLEGEPRVHAVGFDINTDGIKELLERCDTALVWRFHAMVACLTTKTPVLAVDGNHACLEVMEQFGLGRYVFDDSVRDVGAVLATLADLASARTRLRRSTAQRLRRVRASAESQFDYLERLAREREGSGRTARFSD